MMKNATVTAPSTFTPEKKVFPPASRSSEALMGRLRLSIAEGVSGYVHDAIYHIERAVFRRGKTPIGKFNPQFIFLRIPGVPARRRPGRRPAEEDADFPVRRSRAVGPGDLA